MQSKQGEILNSVYNSTYLRDSVVYSTITYVTGIIGVRDVPSTIPHGLNFRGWKFS